MSATIALPLGKREVLQALRREAHRLTGDSTAAGVPRSCRYGSGSESRATAPAKAQGVSAAVPTDESASAGTADYVRRDRECDRHRVDPHAALILDFEAGCRDRGRPVAGGWHPPNACGQIARADLAASSRRSYTQTLVSRAAQLSFVSRPTSAETEAGGR